jgi:hypothetical protein
MTTTELGTMTDICYDCGHPEESHFGWCCRECGRDCEPHNPDGTWHHFICGCGHDVMMDHYSGCAADLYEDDGSYLEEECDCEGFVPCPPEPGPNPAQLAMYSVFELAPEACCLLCDNVAMGDDPYCRDHNPRLVPAVGKN